MRRVGVRSSGATEVSSPDARRMRISGERRLYLPPAQLQYSGSQKGTAVDVKTTIEEVNNAVTSAAVIIGGTWAYFKFIRGRTFAHRAELDVSASLGTGTNSSYLSITITLKNTGLSKLQLNSNMKAIRLFRIAAEADDGPSLVRWQRILTSPIFEAHAWLEAQETVTDTVVYDVHGSGVSDADHAVYQMEAIVGARRRLITRRGTMWTSRAVVFMPTNNSAQSLPQKPDAVAWSSGKQALLCRVSYLLKGRR